MGCDNLYPEEHAGNSWDFIGVCSSEEIAVEACEDEYYFTGPIEMNKILPKEMVEWPGVYRPKGNKE